METVRLTTAEAIVRYLIAQKTVIDERTVPLFPGVYAIFGHGNVTCLGHALQSVQNELPTWRGQNEQGMALAATAFAKASRRRQIMVATSSIGPGATNMVTAAGVAMANRLPLLLIAGDTFQSRIPDPVLQQVEHFGEPSTTVNDSFRAVTRYWDRITHPAQIMQSLPHAVHTMLDPGDCGPAFIGLPQDVQAMAYDYPVRFFDEVLHEPRRQRPDSGELAKAAAALALAEKPLIIAGGGVHWSEAEAELLSFAELHNIPVVETVAGRTSMPAVAPVCTPAPSASPGVPRPTLSPTRLTSWLRSARVCRISRPDRGRSSATRRCTSSGSTRHGSMPPNIAPCPSSATPGSRWPSCRTQPENTEQVTTGRPHARPRSRSTTPTSTRSPHRAVSPSSGLPTYAQVVGVVDRAANDDTYVLTAAGGFPGELVNGWRSDTVHSFDAEYGFSCMGYEIAGGWGAKMAMPDREVVVFVGDGSYMMMNSDLYSSVLSGHKLIVIVCDNGGFAVINRLQINQGGVPFNNLIADSRVAEPVAVDFAAHAAAMGCHAETVATIGELEAAFERARAVDRTAVIALKTDAYTWTEGGSFWEVGVPETSPREEVLAARAALDTGKQHQRVGW